MVTDIVHELFIGRCARCGTVYFANNHTTDSFGISLAACNSQESDEMLRTRIVRDGMRVYARMMCGGRVIKVGHYDAAQAAFRLGGEKAVLDMLGEPRNYIVQGGKRV